MDQKDTEVKNLAISGSHAASAKDQPPPYERQGVPNPLLQPPSVLNWQNANLGCIFVALSREQKLLSTRVNATTATLSPPGLPDLPDPEKCVPESETRRMTNFLLFVLAVDYALDIGIYLTTEVRQHFLTLARWLLDLYRAHKNGRLANEDVTKAQPYLYAYVHAPTRALKVPIDVLVSTSIRHLRSHERHGSYRSCTMDVLEAGGLSSLAEKMFFDGNVLAPLANNRSVIALMWARIDALARRYFSMVGPPSRQIVLMDMMLETTTTARILYKLHDKGKEYEAQRQRRQKMVGWFRSLRKCFS